MERNVCEFAKTEPRIIHCYAMKPKSESAEQTVEIEALPNKNELENLIGVK
jgi:hypothetical protein